jgi:hypothetical protein
MIDFKKKLEEYRRVKAEGEARKKAETEVEAELIVDEDPFGIGSDDAGSEPKKDLEDLDDDAVDVNSLDEFSDGEYDIERPTCSFLTGVAGSGKTFQTRQRIAELEKAGRRGEVLLAASTGIAAVNLGPGVTTIHSLLKFFNYESLQEAFLSGRLQRTMARLCQAGVREIVLDEVSMFPGEMLDLLYQANLEMPNWTKPNGERCRPLLLTLTGDFCQLPPVKAKFAFEADSWPHFAEHTTRLTKIWRQSDPQFLNALNHLRAGEGGPAAEILQSLGIPFHSQIIDEFPGTTLRATNQEVDRYNQLELSKLPGKPVGLKSERWGSQDIFRRNGEVIEKQPADWKDIPQTLVVKEGARVMILVNETEGFTYVNGSTGTLLGFDHLNADDQEQLEKQGQLPVDPSKEFCAVIKLDKDGREVRIYRITRDIVRKQLDETWKDKHAERDSKRARREGIPYQKDVSKRAAKPDWKWCFGECEYFPIRLAWATTVHKCLLPSSVVYVRDRGFIQVGDVHAGDQIWTGDDQHDARVMATARSESRLYRIKTHRGHELLCSGEHRIQTRTALVPARELVEGEDEIQLATQMNLDPEEWGSHPLAGQHDLAWLLGALVGDGSYNDPVEGNIHFCTMDEYLQDRFTRILSTNTLYRLNPGKRENGKGAYVTSKPFRKFLEALGLGYVTAERKTIPRSILGGPKYLWDAFLQGLFDTDGGVYKSGVVYATVSKELARQVHLLLHLRGLAPILGDYPGVNGRYYQVRVGAWGLQRFRELINFSRPYKKMALESCKPNRIIKSYDGYDVVRSVEELDVWAPTVDIEIDSDDHTFMANGMIVSNSQGLSLDRMQIDMRAHFFGSPAMAYVSYSRCRTPEGLRIVGTPEMLARKCVVDPKVREWL